MSNHLFFAIEQDFNCSFVFLSQQDTQHLVKVLRLKEGDAITVSDGKGKIAAGTISCLGLQAKININDVYIDECEELFVHALPSISKGERFEWMLQKLVELGVSEVTPIISDFCIAKSPDVLKMERWSRIMFEAAKQSKRSVLPLLNQPISFKYAAESSFEGENLFCFEKEQGITLQNVLVCGKMSRVRFLTGPEGGYTDKEAELALQNNWKSISLGKRILRCETAPIAVLAALQFTPY